MALPDEPAAPAVRVASVARESAEGDDDAPFRGDEFEVVGHEGRCGVGGDREERLDDEAAVELDGVRRDVPRLGGGLIGAISVIDLNAMAAGLAIELFATGFLYVHQRDARQERGCRCACSRAC